MELVWFQGHKWVRESLKLNEISVIFGNVRRLTVYMMAHPEIELWAEHERASAGHASCLSLHRDLN
jgi:ATP-dependent DNA helicase RecG